MIVCGINYLVLIILWWCAKKEKLPPWCAKKEIKQIYLILCCATTLAMILFSMERKDMRKTDGTVRRNSYGEGSRKETLEATVGKKTGKKAKKIELEIEIPERKYSKKEIQKVFQRVMKELDLMILGKNKSLDYINQNLNLVTSIPGESIEVSWEVDHYEVVNVYGELQSDQLTKEGTLVELKGTLSYEGEEAQYITNIMVYPPKQTNTQELVHSIKQLITEEEQKTKELEVVTLPKKVEGKSIRWAVPKHRDGYWILCLGLLCAGLILVQKKHKVEQEKKKRKYQMMLDYPELINKFTLLVGAGMTIRNVWKRMVSDYQEQQDILGTRYAYEEMRYTYHEMQGGISEIESYERFGKRCGQPSYLKFGALLSQNLRKGTKGLVELLTLEAIQAFEERKSLAKRLGEEASTKLLVPMFLMLVIVLIIIIIPAFLSIQL